MRTLLGLTLAVALGATAASAQAPGGSRTYDLTQDRAWSEVLTFMASKGMTPSVTDRANGRIVASNSDGWAAYITCPKIRGLTADYELTVMLAPDGANRTTVIASLDGGGDLVRRKRFLFIKGHRVIKKYDCPSTGLLEKQLFDALGAPKA